MKPLPNLLTELMLQESMRVNAMMAKAITEMSPPDRVEVHSYHEHGNGITFTTETWRKQGFTIVKESIEIKCDCGHCDGGFSGSYIVVK